MKNNHLIRKIGSSILGVLIIAYVVYQSFLIDSYAVVTEVATYSKMYDSVNMDAWFVKDESYVTNTESGILSFKVSQGQRVSPGEVIADIYASETHANAQQQIERIELEIESLEKLMSAGSSMTVATEQIGANINGSITDFLIELSKNSYGEMATKRDSVQYYLNQKKLITGDESIDIYNSRIIELQEQKSLLETKYSGRWSYVASTHSGYFSTNIDGYEHSFDVENIENITVNDIENVTKTTVPTSAIGKVSEGFTWYIVGTINENQKIQLEGKTYVSIYVPNAIQGSVPVKIVSINKDDESEMYSVVLSCDYMNEDLSKIRNETVEIVTGTYAGVMVKESAIRFNDITKTVTDENGVKQEVVYENVRGVYVKYGNKLTFVQIFSDMTVNGYAICHLNLSESEKERLVTGRTINLYDAIVTQGENLYDGKLL